MRDDCAVWIKFLNSPQAVSRPFMDFDTKILAEDIGLFSDASRAQEGRGFGCYYRELGAWTRELWEKQFIQKFDPSIQFLELYALAVAIKLWGYNFKNRRIEVKCDNESVVNMVNNSTSKCPQCMCLIRILTQCSMEYNIRVFAKHLGSKANAIADALSRNQMKRFWNLVPGDTTNQYPDPLPKELWPIPAAWFTPN